LEYALSAGLPTPPTGPTEGLPPRGNAPDSAAAGDLRSTVSAGSGDPRRAWQDPRRAVVPVAEFVRIPMPESHDFRYTSVASCGEFSEDSSFSRSFSADPCEAHICVLCGECMHRKSIIACMAAVCCLAGSAGCCCCQRGFHVRGDWSLEMDRVPGDCGYGCPHGHCLHGEDGEAPVVSAAPATTPRFHPVPTAPVDHVMGPNLLAPPSLAESPQAVSGPGLSVGPLRGEQAHFAPRAPPNEPVPGQVSVLKREPGASSTASSWMFVRREPTGSAPPDLARRRQLSAEAWTPTRRR
jgi:hypothetical protein